MSLVGSGGGAAGGGSAGHRGGGSVPERGGGVVAEVNESRGKGAVATRERRCRLLTRRGARPGSVRTHRSASPFPSERPAERRAFAHGSPTPPPLSAGTRKPRTAGEGTTRAALRGAAGRCGRGGPPERGARCLWGTWMRVWWFMWAASARTALYAAARKQCFGSLGIRVSVWGSGQIINSTQRVEIAFKWLVGDAAFRYVRLNHGERFVSSTPQPSRNRGGTAYVRCDLSCKPHGEAPSAAG